MQADNTPQSGSTPTTLAQPGGIPPAEPSALRQNLSVGLIALGSIMMIVVITRMLRRSTKARHSRDTTAYTTKSPPPHELREATSAARHARAKAVPNTAATDRLQHVMADAEELTRRLAAILDNKAARIEVLIEHADQRLQALEAAETAHQASPAAPVHQAASTPAQAHALHQPAHTATAEHEAPISLPIDPLHRKVYDLADKGVSPVEIARQIDRPTGQVELILALRRA